MQGITRVGSPDDTPGFSRLLQAPAESISTGIANSDSHSVQNVTENKKIYREKKFKKSTEKLRYFMKAHTMKLDSKLGQAIYFSDSHSSNHYSKLALQLIY